MVKEKEPNATGASYRPSDGFCWAGFGNTTTDCSVCLACVFEGIFILITPVQIDYKYRAWVRILPRLDNEFSHVACSQDSECMNGGLCAYGRCHCAGNFGGVHCEGQFVLY